MEIRSIDYLQEIIDKLGKDKAMETLELIAYLLTDNGYADARTFIEELIDMVED